MSSENLLDDNFALSSRLNGLKSGRSADDLDQIIGDIIGGTGVQYAELHLSTKHLSSVKSGQIEARDRANLRGSHAGGLHHSLNSPLASGEWLSSDSLLTNEKGKIRFNRWDSGDTPLSPPLYYSPQLSCDSPKFEVRNPRSKIRKRLAQTRYVSTTFRISGSHINLLLDDIKAELQYWSSREAILCCEVVWSSPDGVRQCRLEESIRAAVHRPMIEAKGKLAKQLGIIGPVPHSLTEEKCKSEADPPAGLEVGVYRQFTPRLLEYIHDETGQVHKIYWHFNDQSVLPYVQKLLTSEDSNDNDLTGKTVVAVNLITAQL